MRLTAIFSVLLTLAALPLVARGQDSWLSRYQARVVATQANQPHWATPLITSSPRIEQGFRADFTRQATTNGRSVWNYGSTRGLQFIPFPRTELRLSPPPFFTHSDPRLRDGFGDVAFRVKYRLYGSNEQQHNAVVTAVFSASVPTGKQANGSCCAILTPTLEFGKGFGHLALSTNLAGTLPVSNTPKLGRSIVSNSAVQYQLTHLIWLENECNVTAYKGGRNDGKVQAFTTPGILVSRIPLTHRAVAAGKRPLSLTLGAGEQIALTHFHSYDHAPVFSSRLRF